MLKFYVSERRPRGSLVSTFRVVETASRRVVAKFSTREEAQQCAQARNEEAKS